MTAAFDVEALDWKKNDGLIPSIIQDASNGRVLMLGYMNRQALEATLATKNVTFYSRSRNTLWTKGETSGNSLRLRSIQADCDNDTLLVLATPAGPTCHTGEESCFPPLQHADFLVLPELEKTILSRKQKPESQSYTSSLFQSGVPRMAQKIGEEGVELALAAVTSRETVPDEAADLLYHLLVLLAALGMSFQDVVSVLSQRAKP